MPKPKITEEQFLRDLEAFGGNAYQLAAHYGMTHSSVAARARRLKDRLAQESEAAVELPQFPDDDLPVGEIVDGLKRRFEKRHANVSARQWFPIRIKRDEPFALMLWGDPHLDSNGCNWPLLESHIEVAKQPGVYSLNIGDTLDNWPHGSRLVKLYAHADQSVETAHKLARWFFEDSGITWLVVILGNHDLWPGHTNLKHLIKKPLIMEEWGARFVIKTKSAEFKVWASHDFPGSSQWNSLHGLQKAAHMKAEADLYIAGHTHNWAVHQEESASKGFVYWLARARGYKYIDDHAVRLGHDPQQEGASIMAVFDPHSQSMSGRVQCFADVHKGLRFLNALREDAACA